MFSFSISSCDITSRKWDENTEDQGKNNFYPTLGTFNKHADEEVKFWKQSYVYVNGFSYITCLLNDPIVMHICVIVQHFPDLKLFPRRWFI